MSKLNGYRGSFVINGNVVAEVITVSIDESVNLYTSVAKNDPRVRGDAGEVTSKLSLEMNLDPSDTAGQGAITTGATVTLMEFYPAENTSGKPYYTCAEGVIENITIASPMGHATHNATIHLNEPLVQEAVA